MQQNSRTAALIVFLLLPLVTSISSSILRSEAEKPQANDLDAEPGAAADPEFPADDVYWPKEAGQRWVEAEAVAGDRASKVWP